MSHAPKLVEKPDPDHYIVLTNGYSALNDNASIVSVLLATENVDVFSLWTRLEYIRRNLSGAPCVIFVDIDPYVKMESAENDAGFVFSNVHEARPQSTEALREMIECGKTMGCLAGINEKRCSLTITVSQLGFMSDDMHQKTKEVYDEYYNATKEVHEIEKKINALRAKASLKEDTTDEDAQNEELTALAKQAKELSDLKKQAMATRSVAQRAWLNRENFVVKNLPDSKMMMKHQDEWTDMDGLFPSSATAATRARFRAAALDSGEHAIVFIYHGDFNTRNSIVQTQKFTSDWIQARESRRMAYENLLEKVENDEELKADPSKWALPDRVTDCFMFTLPTDDVGPFMENVARTRSTMQAAFMTSIQRIEQPNADDFGETAMPGAGQEQDVSQ